MDAQAGSIVDPPALAAADDIETTERELQNFAVEVVCDQLVKEGWQFMSWMSMAFQFSPPVAF